MSTAHRAPSTTSLSPSTTSQTPLSFQGLLARWDFALDDLVRASLLVRDLVNVRSHSYLKMESTRCNLCMLDNVDLLQSFAITLWPLWLSAAPRER